MQAAINFKFVSGSNPDLFTIVCLGLSLTGRCGGLPVFKEKKMEVGSLVELINDKWISRSAINRPVKGKVYTVRELFEDDGLRLEEVINEPVVCETTSGLKVFAEPGFVTSRFRELLPPMDISIESILEFEFV